MSISVPDNLMYHELRKDRLLVIVNRLNPVVQLTRSQLKDIHTGKITNWQAVGGDNLPIQVITSHVGSATRAVFQKAVMDGEKYTQGAQLVDSTPLELDLVSYAKGGIGVVSATFFALHPGTSKFIEVPMLTRPFGLITIGQPNAEVRTLIDYVRAGVK
jgi:phosphate transport system substrate-binding protein